MFDIKELTRFLLAQLVLAGDYALRIQPRIKSDDEKGGNIFQTALTDADLSIQAMVEVALLGRFPDVSFHGEEEEKSLNTKYFPKDAEYEVTLDPVNGTRLFVDQFSTFDIVAAVTQNGEIICAIDYLPAKEQCYFALRKAGAFCLSRNEILNGAPWRPFVLPQGGERVMIFEDEDLHRRLDTRFNTVDLVCEYLRAPSGLTLNSILRGELSGWVRRNAHLIDLGAIAFIAGEAGALVTDFRGQPIGPYLRSRERSVPELVAAATPELHERILNALA